MSSKDTSIQAFDISSVTDQIRERVKLAFVEAIPQEQWDSMIEREWRQFTETTGHNRDIPSALSQLCRKALTEIAQERIKEQFASEQWQAAWGEVSKSVMDRIIEDRDKLLNSVLENLVGTAVQRVVESLRVGTNPY
jgi:uncharacterized membrane-anchored protein YjiN (DUF445 family)